ncbi:MAG: signal peptidase I [Candidatus Limnocylindrales bacterium]
MKTAVRWIRRLVDLALIVLVVSVLGLVLAVNVGPSLGHQLIVIRGGSMEPNVHIGSVIEVSRVQPADLRPGDIVTLKEADGNVVSHRITRIINAPNGVYIETKGDANSSVDPALTPVSSVMGRADFSIPDLGYIIYMLSLPTGVLSVLALGMTLMLALWLLEEAENDEDEDEYERDVAQFLEAKRSRELIG